MKNSQQHLGNEANVALRKNINLVPRLLSHDVIFFMVSPLLGRFLVSYDPVALCNDLRSSDFGSVFTSSCVNDACSRLKCILQQSIDKHAPLITKKIKGRLCPWMSSEVKSEMNLRDQLLRKARRTNREIRGC